MPEVLWTICAILGVLVLAYLFTRYVAGRGQGGGPSRLGKRMLTILDQVAVRCTACWSSGNNRGGHNRWMR